MGKKLLCYSISMMFMCPVLMAEAKKSKNNGCDKAESILRELKCRRKGMRWRKDKCLKWKRLKRKIINRPAPISKTAQPTEEKKQCCQVVIMKENAEAKAPAAPLNINLSQKQMTVFGLAQVKKAQPAKKDKWWQIGGGFFVLGFWMSDKRDIRDILLGPYASISSSLSKRFRLSSLIGYGFSPKEEHYLLLGGNLSFLAIGELWLTAGFDTIWAKFDGLEVNTRIFLGNLGADYWPVPWLKLGVRVNLGYKHQVIDCAGKLGAIVGGNMLSVSLHY